MRTAHLSVISNTCLVILKFSVGFTIGSVSIISEAIHSSMDLLAAVIAFFSVKKSAEPPDAGHSFGHGKFEDISGLVEALLIFGAAIIIIAEALIKSADKSGAGIFTRTSPSFGIAATGISVIANWYVSSRLMNVAKENEPIALESDAWHRIRTFTLPLGFCREPILIHFTCNAILDPRLPLVSASLS